MKTSKLTRRRFAQTAAGMAVVASTARCATAAGASIQVGVIGLGQRGRILYREAIESGMVRVAAVADIDRQRLDVAKADSKFIEMRKLLDLKEIDAVLIAVPTHWQALAAIWALQAGKHVFLEAPVAYTPQEAKLVQSAAATYGRVVQVGTYLRSTPLLESAKELIQRHELGNANVIKCWSTGLPRPKLSAEVSDPPAHVDYAQWLGPARRAQFVPRRFHDGWRWFWDYGCGDLGERTISWIDLALAVAGWRPQVVECISSGAHLTEDRSWDAPEVHSAGFRLMVGHGEVELSCETRSRDIWVQGGGFLSFHERGTLRADSGGWRIQWQDASREPLEGGFPPPVDKNMYASHLRNFFNAILEGQTPASPVADHDATMLVHLANAVTRSEFVEPAAFSAEKGRFVNAERINTYLQREYHNGFSLPKQ